MPSPLLAQFTGSQRVLLVVAAPIEFAAVVRGLGITLPDPAPTITEWLLYALHPRFDAVLTGIGKSNAAGALARVLDPARHSAVLSLGIAGALGPTPPPLGSIVVASASVFADEGIAMPGSFADVAAMGFPLAPGLPGSSIPTDPRLLSALRGLTTPAGPASVGPVATVSTCSGRDDLAAAVAVRTGAVAEAMEGAAVQLIARRLAVPAGELRAISNSTGDRPKQTWRITEALAALSGAVAAL